MSKERKCIIRLSPKPWYCITVGRHTTSFFSIPDWVYDANAAIAQTDYTKYWMCREVKPADKDSM